MDILIVVGAIGALGLIAWTGQFVVPRPFTVREHQLALRFRKGRLVGSAAPGRYWIYWGTDIQTVDKRRRQLVVSGQEVLTSDRVPIKVSLVVEYSLTDAVKALTAVESYSDMLYGRVQLALREQVATLELDAALEGRGVLGASILASVAEPALDYGLTVHDVQVRDFMMAAGLRNAYADVIQAKQEGLAALERARSTSAAVRSLANSAQLMERHPGLMQLRLLEAVERGAGNKVVIALDPERSRGGEIGVEAEADD